MPDWSLSNWAVVAIVNWPTSSTWIPTPCPGDDSSYFLRRGRGAAREKRARGESRWKKNARNNRSHRGSAGARYGGRSHHGIEVDPQDHGKNRRGSPADRHPRLG